MKAEDWSIETIELWAIALTDLQITKSEFETARRKSLSLEWMPTAPADFLKLSRTDKTSNYPDMKAAYLQAANGEYKHEVILETAKRVGTWELKTQPESVSYKSWQQHYPIVCEEHSKRKSFKVPESHQVEYEHTPVQPNTAYASTIDDFLNRYSSKAKTL